MTQLYDNNHYNSVDRCDKYSTDDNVWMNLLTIQKNV